MNLLGHRCCDKSGVHVILQTLVIVFCRVYRFCKWDQRLLHKRPHNLSSKLCRLKRRVPSPEAEAKGDLKQVAMASKVLLVDGLKTHGE